MRNLKGLYSWQRTQSYIHKQSGIWNVLIDDRTHFYIYEKCRTWNVLIGGREHITLSMSMRNTELEMSFFMTENTNLCRTWNIIIDDREHMAISTRNAELGMSLLVTENTVILTVPAIPDQMGWLNE